MIKKIIFFFFPTEAKQNKLRIARINTKYYLGIWRWRKRTKADIFDYKKTIEKYNFKCDELYFRNCWYGIASSLKKYTGEKGKIKGCIEHGVYFGDTVREVETNESGLPAVITFSETRKNHIRKKTNKPVFTIGPYIYYAMGYYETEEIHAIKQKLGRILLVFPSHSINVASVVFDEHFFVNEIDRVIEKQNIQNVIVCLYWKDILLGREQIYLQSGFRVVTAGLPEDPWFLERLKTYIDLSDYTMSNSVGTHIGYCVALGKPHYLVEQDMGIENTEKVSIETLKYHVINESTNFESEIEEVKKAFSKYSAEVSDIQLAVCNKYWGLNKKKSVEELYFILHTCDTIYKKGKNQKEGFYTHFMDMQRAPLKKWEIEILKQAK